ncbi:MAG: hypothetical protein H6834_17060 [Planctomycetes bacterium]|nr:hypothetical protein [Planctomycetota bacterium]
MIPGDAGLNRYVLRGLEEIAILVRREFQEGVATVGRLNLGVQFAWSYLVDPNFRIEVGGTRILGGEFFFQR